MGQEVSLGTWQDEKRSTSTAYFAFRSSDLREPISPEGRECRWASVDEAQELLMDKNGILQAVEELSRVMKWTGK